MGAAGHQDAQSLIDMLPGVPLVESPFFDEIRDTAFPEPELRAVATALNRDGFAVLDFPDPDFSRMAEAIKEELRPLYDRDRSLSKAAYSDNRRLQDAWSFNADVKSIACNEAILAMLQRLYGRRMWPFQTLNFPVGTQQAIHSDSVHFSTLPERFMCGVWVALEDISAGAGPLVYYPGSHKWNVPYNEDFGIRVRGRARLPTQRAYEVFWQAMVDKHGTQPAYFRARKGQALIWSANLLHGGSPQTDPNATRWSQVTHYLGADCMYLTPLASDIPAGNLSLREVRDITSGELVRNSYLGLPLDAFSPTGKAEIGKDTRGEFVPASMPDDYHRGAYLFLNADVLDAGIDPEGHFLDTGMLEGRKYRLADLPSGTDVATLPAGPPAPEPPRKTLLSRMFGRTH